MTGIQNCTSRRIRFMALGYSKIDVAATYEGQSQPNVAPVTIA